MFSKVEGPMKYRKLRIAWGVVAALLVVLWIASYFRSTTLILRLPASRAVQISSAIGRLQLVEFPIPQPPLPSPPRIWTPAEIEAALENDRTYRTLQQQLETYMKLDAPQTTLYISEKIERRRAEFPEELRAKSTATPWLSAAQLGKWAPPSLRTSRPNRLGFSFRSNALGTSCEIPHWFLVTVAGVAGLPLALRTRWRFSLRTLLIATTLIAVALGTIIALSR